MAKQIKSPTTKVVSGDTTKKSLVKGMGQVATRRIDSIKKANPALGKQIGSAGTTKYGAPSYGEKSADAIRAGLRPTKKK